MPVPGLVNDGNFTVAQQNGATTYDFPFAETRNDFKTFIARRVMRVEDAYYTRPFPMTQRGFTRLGSGYLVGISNPQIVEGTNLFEYTETYASLPQQHIIPGTATAQIQQIINLTDDPENPRWAPVPVNDSFDAVFYYDWSIGDTLPPIFRTKLVQYPYGISNALQFGLDITTPPANGLYLAQNSTSARWMGEIYYRETVYVKPPPIKKWKPPTA